MQFALPTAAPTQVALLPYKYSPNPEYQEYTVVLYRMGELQTELTCTISRRALYDGTTEYYLECSYFGEYQMTRSIDHGDRIEVVKDYSGLMTADTPAILRRAIAQNIWLPIESHFSDANSVTLIGEVSMPL